MNAPIVNKHIIHLEIRILAALLVLKLNKSVLQRIARNLIPDDLAPDDLPEPAKDDLQIVVRRDRIQLAHKQHILRRRHIRIRNVPHNLQNRRPRLGLLLGQHLRNLLRRLPLRIINLLIRRNPSPNQPFRRR